MPPLTQTAVPAPTPVDDDTTDALPFTVIEPASGWQPIPWGELWRYRELVYFLAWRDVKVRYKQTLLGVAWAVLQPLLMMVVFTLVFDRPAAAATEDIAYPLFVYAGLVAWALFAAAVSNAAQSVVSAERLITKVYFPRLAIPLASIAASLVDFVLASCVLLAMLVYFGQPPSWTMLLAPVVAALILLAAIGCGAALAALNVAYRDVRYVLPFVMQLWLLATPAIYLESASQKSKAATGVPLTSQVREPSPRVGRARRNWLAVNPLDGLVAFFRATVLGRPLAWHRLIYPALAAALALFGGCYYFRRVEDSFADII